MTANSRLQKLRRRLAENEIDAILISQPENRHYLSGFDGSAGFLLITPLGGLPADYPAKGNPGYRLPLYRAGRNSGP